jgi:hypothetical protein
VRNQVDLTEAGGGLPQSLKNVQIGTSHWIA